jgi:hypothetical protein
MARIVITAQVENAANWETGFRTHGDLFKSQTVVSPISFTVNGDNEVAIFSEVEDVDKYMEILESSETAKAMAHDGVKRDTVKVFVLDKDFNL